MESIDTVGEEVEEEQKKEKEEEEEEGEEEEEKMTTLKSAPAGVAQTLQDWHKYWLIFDVKCWF